MPKGLRVIFLGDVVGAPGRRGVSQVVPLLREELEADLVVANGENIRNGSGITPDLYQSLRAAGVDGVTLGDHALRDRRIVPTLENPAEPIAIPANLPAKSPGKRLLRLSPASGPWQGTNVVVATLLGRVFMNFPADEPFGAADRILAHSLGPGTIAIIEAHAEATSEKAALAYALDGRVAAVVGSHTHVPTADARILPKGTAFLTDLGMCGPFDGVIGRDPAAVVSHFSAAAHASFEVASRDVRVCGCLLEIDPLSGHALSIERVERRVTG